MTLRSCDLMISAVLTLSAKLPLKPIPVFCLHRLLGCRTTVKHDENFNIMIEDDRMTQEQWFQKVQKYLYGQKEHFFGIKCIFPLYCNTQLSWRAMINADIAFLTWYFLYWCINGPHLFKMNLQHNFIKFHTAFSPTHSAVKRAEQIWCTIFSIFSE